MLNLDAYRNKIKIGYLKKLLFLYYKQKPYIMKKQLATFMLITIIAMQSMYLYSQNVGINDDCSNPDSSAMLDVKSTTKGFLPPRLTDGQISQINDPAEGLVVYCTSSSIPLFFEGVKWNTFDGNEYVIGGISTITDIDGNVYETVQIGEQAWMAENLKVITYNDGTPITLEENNTNWSNLSTEAYCWYNNDSVNNADPYGALYNWYAVQTGKLCPSGWHVPSDSEWSELTTFLTNNGHSGTEGRST